MIFFNKMQEIALVARPPGVISSVGPSGTGLAPSIIGLPVGEKKKDLIISKPPLPFLQNAIEEGRPLGSPLHDQTTFL